TFSPNVFIEIYTMAELLATEFVQNSSKYPTYWKKYLPCKLNDPIEARCLQGFLKNFGRLAYRRPLNNTEFDQLNLLAQDFTGKYADTRKVLTHLITSFLLAPQFWFKGVEPARLEDALGPYELATRLSYFIWRSMPDEDLLQAAASGEILNPEKRRALVQKMLDSPRSLQGLDSFVNDWLSLWELRDRSKEIQANSSLPRSVLQAMEDETRDFIRYIFQQQKPAEDILAAKYSVVHPELAKYYGLQHKSTSAAPPSSLEATPRKGVATHASILTLTSDIYSTNPTRRGKWILERLLCQAPPTPEAVESFNFEKLKGKSVKEKMEIHRKSEACAGCHKLMDPIGLGFEGFGPLGLPRTHYPNQQPVETHSSWPTGEAYANAEELVDIWLEKDFFLNCLTTHLLTSALNTELSPANSCQVKSILSLTQSNHAAPVTLKQLMIQITESPQFLTRLRKPFNKE
ncbi:MAG: DUF1592 domain-containing protein, partial [Zetaproteobacteria bacterium]|nr:DUF1592 domain-containing protein [Zetaproteobacteria bacterium]